MHCFTNVFATQINYNNQENGGHFIGEVERYKLEIIKHGNVKIVELLFKLI